MKYRKGEVIPFIIRAIGKITQARNKDFEKLRLQQQRDAFQMTKATGTVIFLTTTFEEKTSIKHGKNGKVESGSTGGD